MGTKARLEVDRIKVDMYTKPISISKMLAVIQNTAVETLHTYLLFVSDASVQTVSHSTCERNELSEQLQKRGISNIDSAT